MHQPTPAPNSRPSSRPGGTTRSQTPPANKSDKPRRSLPHKHNRPNYKISTSPVARANTDRRYPPPHPARGRPQPNHPAEPAAATATETGASEHITRRHVAIAYHWSGKDKLAITSLTWKKKKKKQTANPL